MINLQPTLAPLLKEKYGPTLAKQTLLKKTPKILYKSYETA